MEPIEEQVDTYRIRTKIQSIKLVGEYWYVQFKGSTESIRLGTEQPAWTIGADMIITIERQKPNDFR